MLLVWVIRCRLMGELVSFVSSFLVGVGKICLAYDVFLCRTQDMAWFRLGPYAS